MLPAGLSTAHELPVSFAYLANNCIVLAFDTAGNGSDNVADGRNDAAHESSIIALKRAGTSCFPSSASALI